MSTKTNLILDASIFTAFLVVSNPALTGNTIHEWLSLSFAAARHNEHHHRNERQHANLPTACPLRE